VHGFGQRAGELVHAVQRGELGLGGGGTVGLLRGSRPVLA